MNELDRINEIVKTTNTVDFCIHSYDSVNLVIIGSFDFSYYHEVELTFKEVSYISLPSEFSVPNFRLASTKEISDLSSIVVVGKENLVFCIEAETNKSIIRLPFYVVAEKVSLDEGIVYYYQREDLKQSERIASWVKKTQDV